MIPLLSVSGVIVLLPETVVNVALTVMFVPALYVYGFVLPVMPPVHSWNAYVADGLPVALRYTVDENVIVPISGLYVPVNESDHSIVPLVCVPSVTV